MPTRAQAIVVCKTCGTKWGNVERAAAFEEAADVERGILATSVPRMVRHFQIGHELALGENAPREYLAVIVAVAQRMKSEREASGNDNELPDGADLETRRLTAIEGE